MPIVNAQKSNSPVMNEITFCILLQVMIYFGFLAKIFNHRANFLHKDLGEDTHMEFPAGMKNIGKAIDKDDNSMVENPEAIHEAIEDLPKKRLKLKIMEWL